MRLKSFFATAIFCAAMLVNGNPSVASAQDVWFETDEYNQKWYLRTESVRADKHTIDFDAILVYTNGKYVIRHKQFRYIMGTWSYERSSIRGWTPVTNDEHQERMFNAVKEYLDTL